MTSIGTIIVRVYTSQAEIPIQGAVVIFTRKSGNDSVLLARRVTDESGKTDPVSFYTPDITESMNPGGKVTYASCDLWVQHPGYLQFLAEDVQIFPGVRTVQKVELIPLPQGSNPQWWNEVVLTPPQDL